MTRLVFFRLVFVGLEEWFDSRHSQIEHGSIENITPLGDLATIGPSHTNSIANPSNFLNSADNALRFPTIASCFVHAVLELVNPRPNPIAYSSLGCRSRTAAAGAGICWLCDRDRLIFSPRTTGASNLMGTQFATEIYRATAEAFWQKDECGSLE